MLTKYSCDDFYLKKYHEIQLLNVIMKKNNNIKAAFLGVVKKCHIQVRQNLLGEDETSIKYQNRILPSIYGSNNTNKKNL